MNEYGGSRNILLQVRPGIMWGCHRAASAKALR